MQARCRYSLHTIGRLTPTTIGLLLSRPIVLNAHYTSTPPSHLVPSFGMAPFEFMEKFTVPETRVFPATNGEDLVILACTIFD